MDNHHEFLGRSVHRLLIRRLVLAGAAISVVIALVVLGGELHTLSAIALDGALREVNRFNHQARGVLDDTPIDSARMQNELTQYAERGIELRFGRFVYAGVFDEAGKEIAQTARQDYSRIADVEKMMKSYRHDAPPNGDVVSDIRWIGRVPHVHVSLPLVNSKGQTVAHIEGVFAASSSLLEAMRKSILRVVLIIIAVVGVITALLYPTIVTLLRRLAKLTVDLLDSNLETLQILGSAIAKRDSDTDVHNFRVTVIAVRLAEEMGLTVTDIQGMIKGALLHDVGKIGIRDNVLLKPGKLDDEEYEIMKQHVPHGLDIVRRSRWLQDATDIVAYHHEKFDGAGYHAGLSGEGIPQAARIFAIADVFDALTSRRPYKEPFSFEKTMEILEEGRGSHFDPVALDKFRGIARSLYDELAGRDDDTPKRVLGGIIKHYFSRDVLV